MPSEQRAALVQTPVGAELLTFTHLVGRDEISRCLAYTVGFVSTNADIDPLKMLGGAVSIEGEADPKRWFSGLIAEFRLTRIEDRLAHYEAVVRPWLWFLGNTTDCRIFQDKTAVEIVEEIFSKYGGIAKFEKRLQGSYPPREYCVQYDESDLDFVQRLLEHEGIMYFFEHAEGEHTLILADATSKLKPAPGYETVLYQFEGQGSRRDVEYITDWIPGSAVRPGAYAHTDYDFEKPAADLMAKSAQAFGHKQAAGENYRHPGAHLEVGRGDSLAAIRREEIQAPHMRIAAVGTVRGLFSGCTFKLDGFPRDDQNKEYLVISAEYRLFDPGYRAGVDTDGENFKVVLGVAPTSVAYRPPRITPRPIMRGPQTATVVGPSGEEIFTDKYARVKVQFHWDRLGKKDQKSSCFVRVSQTWAGSGWGFIQIPRIGQEVIVDFIEGNPDLPIITGRVYNASQMPPYGLPGNATQSGWKSNSSKGGGGYNELMFEDKAGSELVNFQAQKDHHLLIKNDRQKLVQHDQSDRIDHDAKHSVGHNLDEDVGNNKTVKVGVDQTTNIGSNDTETVGVNRALTVGANETIHVMSNSTENIDANHSQTVGIVQTVTVGAARVDTVGAAEQRTVGGLQSNTIGATRSVSVGISQTHSIGTSDTWTIGAGQNISIGAGQSVAIAASQTTDVGASRAANIKSNDSTDVGGGYILKVAKGSLTDVKENTGIKVGKSLSVEAADDITLKCGSSKIVMKKDGTIIIDGKDITVTGSGKINVKASSDVIIKGSKINEN
ncbi:type VI secretion system tip protein VgrG [Mesorhizobium sp. C416B]|uniref:type VI secretion system Vgr family protein n=1 Tax=unclassified Mesorhizobium TaxID=325217 RepID=UPI0003CF28EA|nr:MULTISPECIES: type VI secretion system tip protein TssI/VgrG [unclassified Mesorhizobium]ESX52256.1 type IV secretion protein Rhs [Mesorhizobium sp. LSHC426A00]ESX58834.1 type IV secretion protein Rhs [Mesorhizobium sp. LSHC424B00]ESX76321.1 type IV secretion protein Rhs [Mesorhizobium sp. LSHC416B00]WJI64926.1 type VI secretion system tip protein VgrG [Mesorhizobium sp. C416B]